MVNIRRENTYDNLVCQENADPKRVRPWKTSQLHFVQSHMQGRPKDVSSKMSF
jgi:hypothetical protein